MSTEPVELVTATITIRHFVTSDGGDGVITEVENEAGDLPPILEVLGMLSMAHGAIANPGGIYDQDDES